MFMDWTDGIPSPKDFRLWSAITCVGGALERRVFCSTAQGPIFGNMYVMLVAPPGVGKSEAIKRTERLWARSNKLHIAANSVTSASLIDGLLEAHTAIPISTGILEYNTLLIACDEFGVFMPTYESDFMSKLTKLYDNPNIYRERRRHFNGGKEMQITQPQLTMIAGSQPGYLAAMLPELAWSQGLMSRFVMIYSATSPKLDLFTSSQTGARFENELAERIVALSDKIGNVSWSDDAADAMRSYYAAGMPPEPEHSRLVHYRVRRPVHMIKLCLISAMSSNPDAMQIQLTDVERAKLWLLSAEHKMTDVFHSMEGKSDISILQDLHYAMWHKFLSSKAPIHETWIYQFLSSRTTSDKVFRLIDVAVKAGMLRQELGINSKLYTPRPKHEHGLESA